MGVYCNQLASEWGIAGLEEFRNRTLASWRYICFLRFMKHTLVEVNAAYISLRRCLTSIT